MLDRIILLVLFIVMLIFCWMLIHAPGASTENISWARTEVGTIIGAIIGVVTGAALARKDPAPPDAPDSDTAPGEKPADGAK